MAVQVGSLFSSCFGCLVPTRAAAAPLLPSGPKGRGRFAPHAAQTATRARAPHAPLPPRPTPAQQAAHARMVDDAELLRGQAASLMQRARELAAQTDSLVALELDHGYKTAPSHGLQADLLRLVPPQASCTTGGSATSSAGAPAVGETTAAGTTSAAGSTSAAAQAPQPPPLAGLEPDVVAAAMVRYPAFAQQYAWEFFEHARTTFVPKPPPRASWWSSKPAPVIDLRDHVHHAALALARLLPEAARPQVDTAMMHFDHEVLRVAYRNTETLVMNEPLSTIEREYFWVTADGYAWDMRELVAAIVANGAVFKNPLSHTWLCESDIKAILAHPLGAELRRTRAAHERLRNGVRRDSAVALQKLGTALMTDTANDGGKAIASANAISEFRAYTLTLPQQEQDALAALPTAGIDSHTGAVYSASTVKAVLADGGTCFHKRGDLLRQTANDLLSRMGRA